MAWTGSKTDWVESDYFNATDYNRIVNNIKAVYDLYDDIGPSVTMKDMTASKTTGSSLYASEVNAMEDNVAAIKSGYYSHLSDVPVIYEPLNSYHDNGSVPTASEWNALEADIENLYEACKNEYYGRRMLKMNLGFNGGMFG